MGVMRTLGFPELLVILGVVVMMGLPLLVIGGIVWLITRRKQPAPQLFCGQCGSALDPVARFCVRCGPPRLA
jgi:hypothetical protein